MASTDSNEETLTLRFGQNIAAAEVNEVAAVFNATAVASAADAIHGAMSASLAVDAFELSLDSTSMMGAARTLGQSTTPAEHPPCLVPRHHRRA